VVAPSKSRQSSPLKDSVKDLDLKAPRSRVQRSQKSADSDLLPNAPRVAKVDSPTRASRISSGQLTNLWGNTADEESGVVPGIPDPRETALAELAEAAKKFRKSVKGGRI